jgi:hypothetical protein
MMPQRRPASVAIVIGIVIFSVAALAVLFLADAWWNETDSRVPRSVLQQDSIVERMADSVRMPEVVGLVEREAVMRLQSAGFAVVIEREARKSAPQGVAIGQQPAAGTPTRVGTIVTIFVSLGP